MLGAKLQIAILIAIFIYYMVLLSLLKKKTLSLKYTLLWLVAGLILLIFAVAPQLLGMFTAVLGIQVPTNALFAIVSFCSIMIMISLTAIVSKQSERIKRLTQSIALLENRLREIETHNSKKINE